MSEVMPSPVESFGRLAGFLGIGLLVKRDDLLPFPLSGNKVRKIIAELDSLACVPDALVTNGAVSSNHCRTLAMVGALRGVPVELVLHSDEPTSSSPTALRLLDDLGAHVTIVPSKDIAATIFQIVVSWTALGKDVHVVAGGCHTPAGASAYYEAALETIRAYQPDCVILASGTGATQGGVAAAASVLGRKSRVVGFSVARSAARGRTAVLEAAQWAGAPSDVPIDFRDSHVDGGYGCHGVVTERAVQLGWKYGLPLDPTYTGKAFAGMLDMVESGEIGRGENVLLWHTGGLANYLNGGASRAAGL